MKRGDKMKKIRLVLLVLILSLLLTSCSSFRLSTSIEDLISPVSPSGDNAGVQGAVDEFCKSGYLIKIPSSGDYTTSFIFRDMDGDSKDEAFAFYESNSQRGTASIALLKKDNRKWVVVDNITGEGADVRSVDFSDINGDGREEILVCWSLISKSSNYKLCAYNINQTDDSFKLKAISNPITAGDFVCADLNNDGVNEAVVFSAGTSSESPTARLYSFKDNKKSLLGETKLDSTIISFENIIVGKTDEGVSIYADALKSDGNSMVTELLYWSNYYDSIVSPFYSYNTGRTKDTSRSSLIECKDINSDGVIEIPLDKSISGLPKHITAQSWVVYENTVLNHKCYTYSCKRDGYSFLVDDSRFSKLSVKYDSDSRRLSLCSTKDNKECVSIITVIKSAYDSQAESLKGYTQVFDNSGYIYLAKVNSSADVKFTVEEIGNMIKPY